MAPGVSNCDISTWSPAQRDAIAKASSSKMEEAAVPNRFVERVPNPKLHPSCHVDERTMSKSDRHLKEYQKKRDFRRTSEPPGGSTGKRTGKPRFVIQEHDASTRHYDFRLEVNGVLKSWAVPKGPSTDPREKRLAVPTEDHPLEYASFEGVIPEDQYGAGTVIVWDHGSYRNLTEDRGDEVPLNAAIENGHIAIWLEGEKLQGGYALTRMSGRRKEQWLLVKMDDEHADARRKPTSTQTKSVLSGRTIEEIATDAKDEE